MRKKTKEIKIRASEEDFKKIKLHAENRKLTMSEFLRRSALSLHLPNPERVIIKQTEKKIVYKNGCKPDPDKVFQLSKIGNNLNQIARKLNLAEFQAIEQVEILAELQGIRETLEKLKDNPDD